MHFIANVWGRINVSLLSYIIINSWQDICLSSALLCISGLLILRWHPSIRLLLMIECNFISPYFISISVHIEDISYHPGPSDQLKFKCAHLMGNYLTLNMLSSYRLSSLCHYQNTLDFEHILRDGVINNFLNIGYSIFSHTWYNFFRKYQRK